MTRPLRILLDMHAVGENLSGNEVYVKNLAKSMLALGHQDLRFHLAFGHERDLAHFETFSGTRRAEDFEYTLLHTNSSLRRLTWLFPKTLATGKFDVAHFQYVLPAFVPGRTRTVVVVHDMSYRVFPEQYTWKQRLIGKATDMSVRRADAVLTVSEFSRSEILRLHPHLGGESVLTTYVGVDTEVFRKNEGTERGSEVEALETRIGNPLPRDFLLAVGNLQPRKNLKRLLEAFDRISARHPRLGLVITGRKAWKYDEILEEIGRRARSRVVFTDYVEQQELVALYRACRLFVYPSLYEGFGLPVLEAIACGAVALTSRSSSLQEICPVPEALFEPLDVESIAEGILGCLEDGGRRDRIWSAQRELVGRFTWKSVAEETVSVYRACAGGNRRASPA